MAEDPKKLGNAGEKAAIRYLKRQGYKILARNYICPAGEIDVVCFDGDAIVFVEVKTRRHDSDADPEANINAYKRRKLEQVARQWLRAHREPDCGYRFDAVSVLFPVSGKPSVRHIEEAFLPVERH